LLSIVTPKGGGHDWVINSHQHFKNKDTEMDTESGKHLIPHPVIRLDLPSPESYDDFLLRFESAVPAFNRESAAALVERTAPWPEVVADANASAPHDFLRYWKLDLTSMMSLAGNKRRATEYLMGNHVIAEAMYRHDPAVGLYVPLRCIIYEGDVETRFAIEQPSTTLSSLGRDEIVEIGKDLDHKLARLLDVLGAEVPSVLL
jgi:Domain of unknown function DUF302